MDVERSPGDLPFGLYWMEPYGYYVLALKCMNCRRQVVSFLDHHAYMLHRFGIVVSYSICVGCAN